MSDVFISYAKEDATKARLISEKLGAAGFSVWWDRRIVPGKTWDEVIGASLDSASCVVVLWSQISVQSRWVREEAERGAVRHTLVPILIEKVEPPLGFARIEAADLSAWQGEATDPEFASVCDAIASLLKTPVRPVPAFQPPAAPKPLAAPQPPMPSIQYFLGRWQVNGPGGGSDIIYLSDGTFRGYQMQNIAGYNNQIGVFGRWNIQVLGADMFQLQLWYANMATWAGSFRILDQDHIQSLEWSYIAVRVR